MGYNQQNKAKGIPYLTNASTSSTDLYPTSAGIDYPYDVWVDFTNKNAVLIYDVPSAAEGNIRTARSIITYMQKDYPLNPEYGDIWIKPNGIARIYRLPPYGWQLLTQAASAIAPTPGASAFAWEYQLGDITNIQPTLNTYDALWQENISAASPSASGYLAVPDSTSPHIHIYNPTDWSLLANPSTVPTNDARGMDWSPDGTMLAVSTHNATRTLYVYDTTDPNPANWTTLNDPAPGRDTQPTGESWACSFNNDGSLLAQTNSNSPEIFVWNTTTWTLLSTPAVTPNGRSEDCHFSPDGTMCAFGGSSDPELIVYDTTVSPWTSITIALKPTNHVHAVRFSHDNTLLAVGDNDSDLSIYNTTTWARLQNIDTGGGKIDALAWSPDDAWVAVGKKSSPYFVVYETSGWTTLTTPASVPTDPVGGVDFNLDGTVCAMTQDDVPRLFLYDTTTSPWTKIANPSSLPTSMNRPPQQLAFGSTISAVASTGGGNMLIPSAGTTTTADFAQEPYWDTYGTSAMMPSV